MKRRAAEPSAHDAQPIRHAIRVRGTVQGVGFRPAVYRAACAARLGGFVRNDSEGVLVEVEGPRPTVEAFPDTIRRAAPPLARIDAIEVTIVRARGDRDFCVARSGEAALVRARIPADTATCDDCVRELFDPEDRRFRYPFIVCTNCGPRYTIVRDLPYDRARTTMASFVMCAACREEYEDPTNRRFHAEPVACPQCGPRIAFLERGDETLERVAEGEDALARAALLLRSGAIVALKGLGGYQLAVDAHDDDAVARLRARKGRPHKPFALMVRDLAALDEIVVVDPAARAALLTPARPILLAPRHGGAVAPSVAPSLRELGVMLPTTALHHLLLAEASPVLVMTSGNLSDEPIAADDDDAVERLSAIADGGLLIHDRPIHTRADDSVGRVVAGALQPVRRGRGWAPEPIALGVDAPPILAVGAELKNAICITRTNEAFVSQHVGDLASFDARAFFLEVIARLERLLRVSPTAVAHDLHPDYASTRWALACGARTIAVQHHHAHVASCLVENGHSGPAIGVAFDGTGCGPAGELWGGELLVFDLDGFERVGHLRPLALAGGEAAIREPWRLALAALIDAGEPLEGTELGTDARRRQVCAMIERNIAAPRATGAGRWFDAISALLGVCSTISYEGQAAVELEALAAQREERPYDFGVDGKQPFVIDLRPMVRAVVRDLRERRHVPAIASRFHSTLAEIVLAGCRQARRSHGLDVVALSGGCFQNRLLTERALWRLEGDGFRVLIHRRVPPNDGGLALGQAAVAAHRLLAEGGG